MAVAAASLAAAALSGMAAGRVLSRERARSAARVAALEMMAAEADAGERAPEFTAAPLRPGISPELFGAHEAPSPWGKRLAAAACAAVLLAAGLFAATSSSPGGPATASNLDAALAPIELVALRHVREGDRLTISGIVQNPATGAPILDIVVNALVLGPGGSVLASGGSPVDLTTLPPGGESPFVVSFRVTGDVSRYRVGFRTAGGEVIPHVDRRLPQSFAGRQEQP